MSENKKVDSINNNTPNDNATPKETAETIANLLASTTEQRSEKLTMDYLLGKLEEISLGQAFLTDAISELGKMKSGGPGDVGTQEQAKAIGEIIKAREATNQRLIALYEKMYDDLSGKKVLKDKALSALEKCAGDQNLMDKISGALTEIGFLEE